MKSRLILAFAAVLAIALPIAPAALKTQRASAAADSISLSGLNHIQQRILSGFASFEDNIGVPAHAAAARTGAHMTNTASSLCPSNIRSNVLVNQNCLNITDPDLQGRGQAQNETAIAENPSDPRQIVGGIQRLPARRRQLLRRVQRERRAELDGHHAPDGVHPRDGVWRRGPAVLAGRRRPVGGLGLQGERLLRLPGVPARAVTTNNPDQSSAVYVFRSTGDGGASWNFTGRPAVETFTTDPAACRSTTSPT